MRGYRNEDKASKVVLILGAAMFLAVFTFIVTPGILIHQKRPDLFVPHFAHSKYRPFNSTLGLVKKERKDSRAFPELPRPNDGMPYPFPGGIVNQKCFMPLNRTVCAPSFIIIGAPHCGASDLWSYLHHHPYFDAHSDITQSRMYQQLECSFIRCTFLSYSDMFVSSHSIQNEQKSKKNSSQSSLPQKPSRR